ncbi:MAG: hypothetical protein WCI71_13850 [Bacteroidota bacterium]
METQILCCCVVSNPSCWEIASLFASLFALFVTLGYWAKPQLRLCIYEDDNKWKAKVVNRNLFRTTVKEVKCEIAVSESETFHIANTIGLIKDCTLVIRACPDEYIFISRRFTHRENPDSKYEYIRARLIAPNFLGVRKVFQWVEKISELPQKDCKPRCDCTKMKF